MSEISNVLEWLQDQDFWPSGFKLRGRWPTFTHDEVLHAIDYVRKQVVAGSRKVTPEERAVLDFLDKAHRWTAPVHSEGEMKDIKPPLMISLRADDVAALRDLFRDIEHYGALEYGKSDELAERVGGALMSLQLVLRDTEYGQCPECEHKMGSCQCAMAGWEPEEGYA